MNHSSECSRSMVNDVRLFHEVFGHPILPKPAIPSPERQVTRNKFIRDEYIEELVPAWGAIADLGRKIKEWPVDSKIDPNKMFNDQKIDTLAEYGDAIADVIYFLIGASLEYGLPLQQIWDAVQNANMSKLWTDEEVEAGNFPDGWRAAIAPHTVGLTARHIVCDETGKVRKPPSWKEPDIKAIIRKAMGCSIPSDQPSSL